MKHGKSTTIISRFARFSLYVEFLHFVHPHSETLAYRKTVPIVIALKYLHFRIAARVGEYADQVRFRKRDENVTKDAEQFTSGSKSQILRDVPACARMQHFHECFYTC